MMFSVSSIYRERSLGYSSGVFCKLLKIEVWRETYRWYRGVVSKSPGSLKWILKDEEKQGEKFQGHRTEFCERHGNFGELHVDGTKVDIGQWIGE